MPVLGRYDNRVGVNPQHGLQTDLAAISSRGHVAQARVGPVVVVSMPLGGDRPVEFPRDP